MKLALLALWGCAGLEALTTPAVDAPRVPLPPPRIDGPVWTAVVTEAPRSVPARFSGALGPTVSEMLASPERHPPLEWVAERVCLGADGARDALLEAVRSAPAAGRSEWSEVVRGCTAPDFCRWIVDGVRSEAPAVAAVLSSGLVGCPGPEARRLVLADGVSAAVVVLWFAEQGGAFDSRLEEATRTLLSTESGEYPGVFGLVALSEMADVEAGQALLRLYDTVHPTFRDAVGHAMWGRRDPVLVALHRRACQRSSSPSCARQRVDPLADLDGAVQDPSVDLDRLVADLPSYETAVKGALGRCARGREDDPYRADDCLGALARLDRAEAVALAADPGIGEAGAALAAWPEAGALGRHLGDLGFAVSAEADGVTALQVLRSSGQALDPLDVVSMERLLLRLVALAALDDVPTQAVSPAWDVPAGRHPRTILLAWVDGVRLRSLADSTTGEPDVRWGVAFVNAVLERRGSSQRLALTDWPMAVVVGPPAGLEALGDEGLVTWAEPPLWVAEPVDTDSDPAVRGAP